MDIIIPTPGPKYSDAFIKLVKPYIESLPDDIDIETICELGQFAWNTSVMMKKDPEIMAPITSVFSAMAINQDDKEMEEVFQKMIKDKNAMFPEYDYCIAKFELIEDANGELIIKTLSQSFEDYVKDMSNSLPNSENDFLSSAMPGYINRTALIINFKKSFLDWISSLGIELTKEDLMPLVFLIDEEHDPDHWLAKNFKLPFESILMGSCEDKKLFPKKLTKKGFDEWFDVKFSDAPLDLEPAPVIKSTF